MTNQETITCQNCAHNYAPLEAYCPNCGEANPLLLDAVDELEIVDEIVDEDEEAAELVPEKRPWWRSFTSCLAIVLFFFFIVLGSVWGLYDGLKEQGAAREAEIERNYQEALDYESEGRIELTIAALELVLTMDPTHEEARAKLAELKSEKETPTITPPTPTTRRNIAADLFNEAKALTQQGKWEAALQTLEQIREIDPSYEAFQVSETIYQANYELGLRLTSENKLDEALKVFDDALVERPNDPLVTAELEKTLLYLSVDLSDFANYEENIAILKRIYELDPNFADVKSQLQTAYLDYGDYLTDLEDWCAAEPQYNAAVELRTSNTSNLETKIDQTQERCIASLTPTPTPTRIIVAAVPTASDNTRPRVQATETSEPEPVAGAVSGGHIYIARFNDRSRLWEIYAISPQDGTETVVISDGAQPSVSPDGSILVYHSQHADSFGLHTYNLKTGEDRRVTEFAEDVLPQWGGNSNEFIFASQRSGDRRWQIFMAFADGKSDPRVIVDGRTPALAADGNQIAYQGADPQGNNPGIYLTTKAGGAPVRLTTGASDRTPAFSPDQNTIAYMTAENGNWDIWTVSPGGDEAQPLVSSPANEGHPVWSPDGNYLAFVSDRGGSWGVYIVNAQGGEPQRVASWGNTRPDWLIGRLSWRF